jgi:hypothetical protein
MYGIVRMVKLHLIYRVCCLFFVGSYFDIVRIDSQNKFA